jgi:MinD-like ATPase involved in chromosome partitioning or flagellar assembly|tara:strand:- start:21687 stop:21992 length:306 start_codon:yes stop_codon:yes gene_type:complete
MDRNEKEAIEDKIRRVISAGEKAVDELIKVAEEKIITGDKDDDLAADRLKNAAATKRLAIEDAFVILNRIENEREKLDGEEKDDKKDKGFQSFAESRGRKS